MAAAERTNLQLREQIIVLMAKMLGASMQKNYSIKLREDTFIDPNVVKADIISVEMKSY